MHTRTPLHAASSHLRTTASPQCYCFSLCSTSEIPPFRASIPQLVTSTASPWFLYLRAVYGDFEEGALPFNGWKASLVCRCNDNASALINCAG